MRPADDVVPDGAGVAIDAKTVLNDFGTEVLELLFDGVDSPAEVLVGTVAAAEAGHLAALRPRLFEGVEKGNEVVLQFDGVVTPRRASEKDEVEAFEETASLDRGRVPAIDFVPCIGKFTCDGFGGVFRVACGGTVDDEGFGHGLHSWVFSCRRPVSGATAVYTGRGWGMGWFGRSSASSSCPCCARCGKGVIRVY